MYKPVLGIIGGGQLGSMLATAAKKFDIRTVIFSDNDVAPAKHFANEFICGEYNNLDKIKEFCYKVDVITYEFENIPYEMLKFINSIKKVQPSPEINKIVQNRISEKDFINKCNLRTTLYVHIKKKDELDINLDLLPGLLKTCTLGYDGKGQIKLNSPEEIKKIHLDEEKE